MVFLHRFLAGMSVGFPALPQSLPSLLLPFVLLVGQLSDTGVVFVG